MIANREHAIKDFHEAFSLDVHSDPTIELLKLRKTLIDEEVKELFVEIDTAISYLGRNEPVPSDVYHNMLKELADVQVVVSGMSVALKPLKELEEAFNRVHKSNMSKLGNDGKPIYREDGKVLKGSNYSPPDLKDLIL